MGSVFENVRNKLDEATPKSIEVKLDEEEVVYVKRITEERKILTLDLRALVKATPQGWDDSIPDKIEALVGTVGPLLAVTKNTLKLFKKDNCLLYTSPSPRD